MQNIWFIVLTLVIIIAVILLADSLTTAMLIMSLLANFLVISAQFGKITKNSLGISMRDWDLSTTADEKAPEAAPDRSGDQDLDIYGPYYDLWNQYRYAYTKYYDEPQARVGVSCSERNSGVDCANALIAQKRARDKKCSDGWASKNANYYKYHYADEFDETEARPWWGRNEM